MLNFPEGLNLILVALAAIWAIYQTFVVHRLNRRTRRIMVSLDQSLQTLYRAREAVIRRHETHLFLLELMRLHEENAPLPEIYFQKNAEHSSSWAELRGLAFAIGDKELLDLVNHSYDFGENRNALRDEMEIRGRSQKLHTRIAQLIEDAVQKLR